MKFWQGRQANFPFYLYISTANLPHGLTIKLPNDTVTYWWIHHAVKLSIPPVKLHCLWSMKGLLCSALPFLSTPHFCCCAMESVAVYLGVRFGTGRGEALRLFDCFIMVIYMAIYLCTYTLLRMSLHVHQWVFVCLCACACVCVTE